MGADSFNGHLSQTLRWWLTKVTVKYKFCFISQISSISNWLYLLMTYQKRTARKVRKKTFGREREKTLTIIGWWGRDSSFALVSLFSSFKNSERAAWSNCDSARMAEAPINKDSIRDFISAIALLLAKQLDTWGDAFIGLRKEDTKPRTIVKLCFATSSQTSAQKDKQFSYSDVILFYKNSSKLKNTFVLRLATLAAPYLW